MHLNSGMRRNNGGVCHCYWCDVNDTTLMMNELLFQSMGRTIYLCLLGSDWCISRQLWWGHQVPAYQVELPNSTDKQEVGSVDMCLFNNTTSVKCCTSSVCSGHFIQCNPE